MPRTNVVAIRDERGRYLKGIAGGPGRPLGSRNKLRDDFFADMARKLSSILRAFGPRVAPGAISYRSHLSSFSTWWIGSEDHQLPHAAWLEHGPEVIDRLIAERPEIFLLAMLKIANVHRVEIGQPEEFDRPSSMGNRERSAGSCQ